MLKDKDIREALFEFLEEQYGKSRILEEKGIGNSRADAVMVLPDEIVGIEIKSDADTYVRLKRQIRDYDAHFDSNIVVVGSTHALHIREHVPEHWGILSVEEEDERIDFYWIRGKKKNPCVDAKKKIGILWRPELAQIQKRNQMPVYQTKSKDFVQDKILAAVPQETLNRQICEELFERDYTAIWETIQQFREQELGKKRRRKRKKAFRRKKREDNS